MKSKIITISAISAGLVAICLALGIYVEFIDVFALIISSAFVIMPLYLNSFKGSVMAYLVGGILGLIFGWFNFLYSFVFPAYFIFFGLYPIFACYFRTKKLKKIVTISIGLIWCIAVFYGIFFYYTLVMGYDMSDIPLNLSWLKENILYFIGAFGVLFYFVYDRFIYVMFALINKYLGKIIK